MVRDTGISIHLMLLFISGKYSFYPVYKIISIHLMLLFIFLPDVPPALFINFNTSHVTVYRNFLYFRYSSKENFNTSHVTVYLYVLCVNVASYINFNTSHVTVYQILSVCDFVSPSFQYISCYCLSCRYPHKRKILPISIHLMLLFILLSKPS